MNLLFKISNVYIPTFLKKKELRNLFSITASAFGSSAPSTAGLSFEECLTAFAHFTQTEVRKSIDRDENFQVLQDRLYRGAYEYGGKFRKKFGVSTVNDVMEASRMLYHILGIEFHGTSEGMITICPCFFSKHYSASTCRIISSLDAGMIAGLAGGGTLTFSQRITEGYDSCKAQYISKEHVQ